MVANRALKVGTIAVLCAWLLLTPLCLWPAYANGGTVRVGNERVGPFEVTVFTDPTPVRVGTCDVSVAVVSANGGALVADADVRVAAWPIDKPEGRAEYRATHELATNKLFYAAHVSLPNPGKWRIETAVASAEGEGVVGFEVDAEESTVFDNPLLIAVALLVPLVPAAWLLSRTSRRRQR